MTNTYTSLDIARAASNTLAASTMTWLEVKIFAPRYVVYVASEKTSYLLALHNDKYYFIKAVNKGTLPVVMGLLFGALHNFLCVIGILATILALGLYQGGFFTSFFGA